MEPLATDFAFETGAVSYKVGSGPPHECPKRANEPRQTHTENQEQLQVRGPDRTLLQIALAGAGAATAAPD
jgi:hypothetical protein